ncbi:hypothetical protein JXA47_08170 [Candidatus Sumerlaeota bacterium]|nr:hypothetical protein [Candidatus Sumerlaeota bacterium]
MPTYSQILGTLIVVAVLAIGAREIWVHRHPESQDFPSSDRRLRRRLTGVALILAMVALLTWAGVSAEPRVKLALYGAAFLIVPLLLGLAIADIRETSRQILSDHLDIDPEMTQRLMEDPRLQELVMQLQSGKLSRSDLSELKQRLEDAQGPPEA